MIDALRNSPVLGSSTYLYNVATGASAERASAATQLANLISDIGASVVLPRTSVSPVTGQTTVAVAGGGASGANREDPLDGASGILKAPKSIEYTPPGSVVLQPQGSPFCGPATCNMVINDAKGNAVDLNQVVGQFQGIRTSGVNINEMNTVLNQNGVAGKTTTTLSVDQLNVALANGQPVIVGVPAGTGNHFIIVDSIKTVDNIYYYMTRDPFVGPRGVRSDILTNAINANGNAIIMGE